MKLLMVLMLLIGGGISQAAVVWLGDAELPAYTYEGHLTNPESARVLNVLEQMPWIEEPAKNGSKKYLYIFYYPECPASQELYQESREFAGKVNIRWIPIIDKRYIGLLETRTPGVLKNAFENDIPPKIKNRQVSTNSAYLTNTSYLFLQMMGMLSSDEEGYFPTVIFGNKNRLNVWINPYFDEAVKYATASSDEAKNPYISELAMLDEVKVIPYKEKMTYYTPEDGSVEVYLTGHPDSLLLGVITEERRSFTAVGTTKSGLIVVDLSGDGHYIYFKDSNPKLDFSK